jgi:hypothetical protein
MNPSSTSCRLRPRTLGVLGVLGGCAACAAGLGADPSISPAEAAASGTVEPVEAPSGESPWAFSVSVFTYVVPEDRDYAQPTVTVDRGALHWEARYNYEAHETGSFWVGYNLGGEGKVSWEFTPMLGGVVGETMGVAPGFRGAVGWWRLELASESEFVLDAADASSSFFYNWTELGFALADWVRLGMALQRTRVYGEERDAQWGPWVGFGWRPFDLALYLFNPEESQTTFVVAVGAEF